MTSKNLSTTAENRAVEVHFETSLKKLEQLESKIIKAKLE
jgi:hypothetical protein